MSEKRFFRIFSGRHSAGEGNYLQLFDAISEQEQYVEHRVKAKFRGQKLEKHFASEKNYLYWQVLDSLAIYQREKTYLARHAGMLVSIEQLYKRGLFGQCLKMIRRAKKVAYEQELFPFLLMFLRWETIIYIKDEDEHKLDENIEEEIRISETLRLQFSLMQLAFRIQIKIDKGRADRQYILDTIKRLKTFFPIPKHFDSFWTSYYYHSSIGLLATVQREQKQRNTAYTAIKGLMEASPQFIRDLPGIYHLNMNNLIGVMFKMELYKQAEVLLEEQRAFMDKYGVQNPTLSGIMFLNTSENELFLHYKTRELQKGNKFREKLDPLIRDTHSSFSPLVFDVLFMMSVSAVVNHDFKSASRYLNRILNEEKDLKIRKELRITTRLLYLLVLFETGDRLFESRYQSSRRFFQQEEASRYYTCILELLQLFHRGKEREDPAAFDKKWKELQKERNLHMEDEANKQFDFLLYLQRK